MTNAHSPDPRLLDHDDDAHDGTDGHRLGTALSERLQREQPDLHRLSVHAVAHGTRRRRRRQATLVLCGAAAVGLIAGAGVLLGTAGPGVDGQQQVAAAPAASSPTTEDAIAEGQVRDLGNGLHGTVVKAAEAEHVLGGSMDESGPGAGWALEVSGPLPVLDEWWSQGFGTLTSDLPGITVAISTADARKLGVLGKREAPPVTVGAGWSCEWFLADDKASCSAADGGVAGLVIRDAAERDEWLSHNDPSAYTTEAHDGIFITVQGGLGSTDAELTELGESLAWVD